MSDAIRNAKLASYVRKGNWDKTKRFLESNPDGVRRIITPYGYTALHLAISRGHEGIANELMKLMQEEDFLLRDDDGQTALHLAAGSGFVGHENFETLVRMMSQEALGIQDDFDRTALHVILKNTIPWSETICTVLKARPLIEKMREQDLELRDVDGFTALHYAVHLGAVKILSMLMEKMPQQDMDGNTPLHVAVSSGSVEMVEYLVPLVKVEDLGIQNEHGLTALHMASFYGQIKMVEILVKAMKIEDLETKEKGGRTALSFAVVIGNIDVVKCMIAKNRNLLRIKFEERIPVVSASATQHIKITRYLYSRTRSEELRGIQGVMLLNTLILREMFDIASDLVSICPLLATDLVERCPLTAIASHLDLLQPLLLLAGMPSAFRSGSRLLFWQRWIYSLFVLLEDYSNSQIVHALHVVLKRKFKYIYHRKIINKQALKLQAVICREIQKQMSRDNEMRKKLFHEALIEATKNGIYEIAHKIIYSDPRLFFETDTHSRRMIDLAILHRQENIFNLIHGLHETSWAFFLNHRDGDKNTMLHVAGMVPSNQLTHISGAALRMQRELQWFKEVESILDPLDINAKNSKGETAHELFTKKHEKLVEDGEKWMKAMASSCTVVAALIVTIMFAAA